jgi:hypothetical protein
MEVNYRKGIKHEKERTVNNPPFFDLQFTINNLKNDHVIANEVKQSHISKFRLLRRLTPRNDIDELSE